MDKDKRLERLNELGTAPEGRLLWKYSVPAVVGLVVMAIYNIVDRIFIGQGVGADAIAGLAITFPVMNISTAFGVLIGVGASSRTSIVLGQNDRHFAEHILGNSLVMTLIFGTLYIGTFALFLDPILRLFGASDTSLPYAHDFMVILLPGLLMNNLCFSFNNIMRATGYPTKAMMTMFIGAGLNIVLDPLFIFGFGWGIQGAAIATVISMTVSAGFVMHHFFSRESIIRFRRGTFGLRRDVLLPIVSIGVAPCIVNSAGCVVNAVINNSVYEYGGDAGVGAVGIFITLSQLLVTTIIGICQGMQPIVGFSYGARRFERLKRTFWLSTMVSTIVCGIGWIASQCIPYQMSRMFTTDPALLATSEHALRVTMSMLWVIGSQIVITNFFQAIGAVGKSIFMSLSRQVIFFLPMLLTFPLAWGLEGVWLAFPASDIAAALVGAILMAIEFRQINRWMEQEKAQQA